MVRRSARVFLSCLEKGSWSLESKVSRYHPCCWDASRILEVGDGNPCCC